MANKVTAQVIGGEPKVFDGVNTVREVKERLGVPSYTAVVNGDTASDSDSLDDFAHVSLSAPAKGGR